MTTNVLEDEIFHNPLSQIDDIEQDTYRKSALQGLIDMGHTATLYKSEIYISIAGSKRHERVERAEHIIEILCTSWHQH